MPKDERHDKYLKDLLSSIEANSKFYSKSYIQSVLWKHDSKWNNIASKITFLRKGSPLKKEVLLDYGEIIYVETLLDISELVKILKTFNSENENRIFTIKDFKVKFNSTLDSEGIPLNSKTGVFNLGWPAIWYRTASTGGSHPDLNHPLIKIDLPLFPSTYELIRDKLGFDIAGGQNHLKGSFVFLVPFYKARITKFIRGMKTIEVSIHTNYLNPEELLGKLWCEDDRGNKNQRDVTFKGTEKESKELINLEYKPNNVLFYLLGKNTEEKLDFRRITPYPTWNDETVDDELNEEYIKKLIKSGENQFVELKEKIGDPQKIEKELVAFSNSNNGIILFGINDQTEIKGVGMPFQKFEEKIRNISRNPTPTIKVDVRDFLIDKKDIFVVSVREGNNKPYMTQNKRTLVRVGSTIRDADNYELEELVKGKKDIILY